jgi:hypothetical protein
MAQTIAAAAGPQSPREHKTNKSQSDAGKPEAPDGVPVIVPRNVYDATENARKNPAVRE